MTKDETRVGTDVLSLQLCETGDVGRAEEVQGICKRHFEALC